MGSSSPVAKLYRHDSRLCYEANYSATSGYGAFVQSSTGPLDVDCSSVTSAAWYISAQALSGGGSSSTAGTVSSGYIGITYMVHEATSNAVFGGEMDGRTLSSRLNPGKATEGEIYVVSTTNSVETLLATTETSVQAQLQSNVTVDAESVGGLTGSSALELQSSLSSFSQLWSRSASVSMADSYGQVAQRCPSSSTAAYVAIADGGEWLSSGSEWLSSRESVSLQRANTTGQLELLLVSALPKDAYSSFILPCTYATIVLGFLFFATICCVLLLPHLADVVPYGRLILSVCWIVLIGVTFLVWLTSLTTHHRSAVEDLFSQITTSMNEIFNSTLSDSNKLAKQSSQIWYFTGAPTSGLSQLDAWSVPLMEDFYTTSRVSQMTFATPGGVERGTKSTAGGVRVLNRDADACLQTYLVDGVTLDNITYSDNCNYDPRYTSTYEYGKKVSGSGADNSAIVPSLYSIGATTKLGMGVVVKCVTSSFDGVWSAQFVLDSVGNSLSKLKDGLDGAFFVASADPSGVACYSCCEFFCIGSLGLLLSSALS